jgi:hypothetical protein
MNPSQLSQQCCDNLFIGVHNQNIIGYGLLLLQHRDKLPHTSQTTIQTVG